MLALKVTRDINAWMNRVVALTEGGSLYRGLYDGFRNVDGAELHPSDRPECYHEICWDLSGRPTKYTEASEPSLDQGYFFHDTDHDMREPTIDRDRCVDYTLKEVVEKLTNYLEQFGDMPCVVSGWTKNEDGLSNGTLVTDLSVLAPGGKRICVIDADGSIVNLQE